jgi:hypothetical protein
METISENPQDIQDLAAKFNSTGTITSRMPESPEVELPGGFVGKDGVVIKFATVRELTGRDEEAIARGGNRNLLLNTILTRGLEKLGYDAVTSTDFDNLLAGDRDAILLGIRKITFGKTVDGEIVCPGCGELQDMLIDLDEDIEMVELDDPINGRVFEVDLKAGRAVVGLPNGITQRKVMENASKSSAELVTIFLGGCLISINDQPSMGPSTAASLGILDRETLLTEITKRNPGPRLGAVVKACKACGEDISIPLSLAELFRV